MTMQNMRRVDPVATPAAYIGGKKALSKRLVELIEGVPHNIYVEPFVGMGGVFLKRRHRPKSEVINDLSGDVATFFRILQRHYPQFIETLRFQITSRREFERLKASEVSTLTDLERAGRFLYLQRLAFGGKVQGQHFGIDPSRGGRFNLTRLAPMLEDIHERLAGVVIENLRWQDVIARYDRPETLFYLDPPYWGNEADYGKGMFGRAEFEEMAGMLDGIRGQFILSLNDCPEVRKTFKAFDLAPVELNYSVAGRGRSTPARELIITRLRKGG